MCVCIRVGVYKSERVYVIIQIYEYVTHVSFVCVILPCNGYIFQAFLVHSFCSSIKGDSESNGFIDMGCGFMMGHKAHKAPFYVWRTGNGKEMEEYIFLMCFWW